MIVFKINYFIPRLTYLNNLIDSNIFLYNPITNLELWLSLVGCLLALLFKPGINVFFPFLCEIFMKFHRFYNILHYLLIFRLIEFGEDI